MVDIYQYIGVFLALVLATVVSFFATPLAKKIAFKVGAVDVPKDERRVHKHPIPRLGGLAIYYGFVVSVLIFANIDLPLQGILLGSIIIVALGIVDDVKPLSAKLKLAFQILAALMVVMHGARIEFFTNPNIWSERETIALGWVSYPITLFWIVAITNAVNLIDGLDGLAAGVTSIAAMSLVVVGILANEPNIAVITAALCGACLGFLPYNFNPAKIFMGDTGATFLGFILASLSIQGLFKGYAVISFAVPFLILALPIFDTAFAILRRLFTGKPIMGADRGHLHHRLLDIGFSQKQTVLILYAMCAILGAAAVILTASGAFRAMILVFAILIAIFAAAKYIKTPFWMKIEEPPIKDKK
ncbi:MAG: undecaprenyl/decaprenyl-phosphate alpha-N-acetylglucosaminyl 1-phosphate transferase [Hyphomonadaceae bacterium]|nr:undecaprenyl/decaprenyl-phosphate alpha-N-acetylglucosaminyl 1-phosphate transferase [Clostridia bacterium]